jgi:hypothetical protein
LDVPIVEHKQNTIIFPLLRDAKFRQEKAVWTARNRTLAPLLQ